MEQLSDEVKMLVSLRDVTQQSGALAEYQILHLTYWSMMMFDRAKKKPKFEYSFPNKTLTVNYPAVKPWTWLNLNLFNKRSYDKKFEILSRNVCWLLGCLSVVIKIEGKQVYTYTDHGST